MPRKALLAVALIGSFVGVTAPAVLAKRRKEATPAAAALPQIGSEEKVLHALNRLTFGPRPGDVEAVKAMGVARFIDEQLHPERVAENPVLEAKLVPLDTLRMSTGEMAAKYPPPQRVRAMVEGRLSYPADLATRLMIEKAVEKYKAKLDATSAGKPETDGGKQPDEVSQEQWRKLAAALTPAQRQIFAAGAPAEKTALLASLPEEQQYQILAALPQGKRQQMYGAASPELRRKIQKLSGPQIVVSQDLFSAKIYRAVYSNRQLEEVLTDFWYNHFNVFLDKGADKYLVTSYERDAIRPYVLGKFEDLLLATAKSPAMLFYLDNVQSVGPDAPARNPNAKRARRGLNENYGRELMELHTLGVDGGYTQKDVTEVARCFTGWTIRQARGEAAFEFDPRLHDGGEKTVLGVTIPANGGMNDGLKVIDILAHHPATANFISRSLAIRFVSDNPPRNLVDKMARTFTASGGDLREVMRTMLDAPEFWSPTVYRVKLKTPFEMIVSAIRATGGEVDYPFALNQQLAQLGEPLYRKVEPTGYSNRGSDWINSASLLARMNFALSLTSSKVPGTKVDLSRFSQAEPMGVARALLMTDLSAESRQVIERGLAEQVGAAPSASLIAGLALGSPDFQKR